MQPLVSAESMREMDALAVRQYQIPDVLLMEHAALAVVGALAQRFSRSLAKTRGAVVAGHGNNGADAIAASRMLWLGGTRQLQIILSKAAKPSPLCRLQLGMAERLGIPISEDLESALASCDWVLDGILGIGLQESPQGLYRDWIQSINQVSGRKYILAIDVPSGVQATTGQVPGVAIRANRTVTFGFYKAGLLTGEALNYVGNLSLATIQIPRELAEDRLVAAAVEPGDIRSWLPTRQRNAHKGTFGKVSVIAGQSTMVGATALTTLGALHAGAGIVETWTWQEAPIERGLLPREVIVKPIAGWESGPQHVLVVGPGLGQSEAAQKLFDKCLGWKGPLVIDADGLNLLAQDRRQQIEKHRAGLPTLITPHPKEAARMLDSEIVVIESNRYRASRELAKQFGAVALLKGAGSIVSNTEASLVVPTGDPGLSKGGSGDVLAGLCAGFMAQGLDPLRAGTVGAFLHGRASEILTQKYGATFVATASEIAETVGAAVQEICR